MPQQFVPTPTESVEIDLGDGKIRALRYSLASMKRIKAKFGKSLLSQEALLSLDEETIPELIFEGLKDREGLASSAEVAELIDTTRLKQILEAFFLAFSGAMPEKNAKAQQGAVSLVQ